VVSGGDRDFVPDIRLKDGDMAAGDGWELEALHTPGHCSNHLCFALPQENTLFVGDQVMGWSTTVINPPDGNMAQYMRALERLLGRAKAGQDRLYRPTHGSSIADPAKRLTELIEHRNRRRQRILERLAAGDDRIPAIVKAIYVLPHKDLAPAAGRSVLAQMQELIEEGLVVADGEPGVEARFRLA
jgi:glyoxylase-like metal-dependent hydrolase (beta-lactamase superfamily II)